MALITSTEWDSLIQTRAKMSTVVRIYFGDATDAVDFIGLTDSAKPIVIEGVLYTPLLLKAPSIKAGINVRTFEHTISGDSLIINNQDLRGQSQAPGKRFTDEIATRASGAGDIGFYNRKIEIRRHITGNTTWANCMAVMKEGIVRDISHTRKKTTIKFEDHSDLSYVNLGVLIADSDGADADIGVPETSRGMMKPIVSGDHLFNLVDAGVSRTDAKASTVNNMVKLISLGLDVTGATTRYLISSRKLKSVGNIWQYNSTLERPVRIGGSLVQESNDDTDGAISTLTNSYKSITDYFFGDGTTSGAADTGGGAAAWQDASQMCDRDFTTRAHCVINESTPDGRYTEVGIDFPTYGNPEITDDEIISVSVGAYIKITSDEEGENTWAGNGNVEDWFEFYVSLDGGVTYSSGHIVDLTDSAETKIVLFSDSTAGKADELPDTLMVRAKKIAAGDAGDDLVVHIYQIWKEVLSATGLVTGDVYAGVEGAPYESWVDDREAGADADARTGDDYEYTHDDHDEFTNNDPFLIQNFAGGIEDLLRDHLSLADGGIDMGGLNKASTLIPTASNWLAATNITKRIAAKKYLSELVRSCKSWVWWPPDNYAIMQVIEDGYSASDLVIDARKVENLKFTRTPLADLKTAVNVHYNYNQMSGDNFSAQTGIAEDTACQTFYNVTEEETTLDFESAHVHSALMAVNLQTFWLYWLKNLHNLVSGELPREYLKRDIGDIIEFSNMAYKVYGEDIESNTTRAGQTIYKYWKIYEVDRGATLKFKAIQMHRLIAEV